MDHFFSNYFYNKSFWLIISILFLSACGSTGPYQAYEGPAKADSEVATFIVPTNYNLLSINAVHYQKKFLKDGATINLLPGSHQLIIEYHDIWDLTGQEHEKVTSKPIAITFTAQAGTQYSIHAEPLKSVEQAQVFAKKPSISIMDMTTKQTVSAKIKYNLYGQGLFTTLFGGSQPESAQPSVATTNTAKTGKALEMLKYWWETADESQQGDFRQWLKSQ